MNTVNLGRVRGEPFTIDKTYSSIEEMNNSFATDDVKKDHFVVIDTGNVEDEDNGKLYRKDEDGYTFIVDMSGKKGEDGAKGEPGDIGDFSNLSDGTNVKTSGKIPVEQDGTVKKYTIEDVTKDKLPIKNPIAEGVLKTKADGSSDSDSFFVVNPENTTDSETGTPRKTVKVNGHFWDYMKVSPSIYINNKLYYYWFKLLSLPSINGSCVFVISTHNDSNYPSYSQWIIEVGRYTQYNTLSVRVVNSIPNYNNSKLCVAISVTGDIYIQIESDWGTGLTAIKIEFTKFPYQDIIKGEYSDLGTAKGFEAKHIITNYGAVKYDIKNNTITEEKNNTFITDSLTVTGATTTDSFDAESADIRDLTARYVNGTVLASDDTNTGIGNGTLMFNSTGQYNTAVGIKSLGNNSTGVDNTAVGHQALTSNSTGSGNTATGHRALVSNTTGHGNTAVGRGALMSNSTGSYNIALGEYRSCIKSDWDNQVNIGDRLRYIEFAASATQDTVYKTLISFLPFNKDGEGVLWINCIGKFRNEIESMANDNDGNIDFLDKRGQICLTAYKGSSSTLGFPLRLWFPDVTNDVSPTNK